MKCNELGYRAALLQLFPLLQSAYTSSPVFSSNSSTCSACMTPIKGFMCDRFAWLPFGLHLVRAPSTVPGHSGTPAIEAELREGREGTERGHWGVDVTSPAGL